ncbi:hypothetical protein ACFLSE_05360 [Bacteroidota bacterium]
MNILKIKTLTSLFALVIIANFSIAQKVTTEEFLNEKPLENLTVHKTFDNILSAATPIETKLGKQIKGAVNDKSPVMLVAGEKEFPTPYVVHKITNIKERITVELYSLGDMAGFKKVIMFPIIFIYNENGVLMEQTKLNLYESRAPTGKYPYHIFASWIVDVPQPGNYYLIIAADNSSTDEVGLYASTGYENASGVSKAGKGWLTNYSCKRSTYGKYRLTVK